jgi:hypothetical protein
VGGGGVRKIAGRGVAEPTPTEYSDDLRVHFYALRVADAGAGQKFAREDWLDAVV